MPFARLEQLMNTLDPIERSRLQHAVADAVASSLQPVREQSTAHRLVTRAPAPITRTQINERTKMAVELVLILRHDCGWTIGRIRDCLVSQLDAHVKGTFNPQKNRGGYVVPGSDREHDATQLEELATEAARAGRSTP